MSLNTWAGFRDRRITPMALFALQAAADAGEPRVRLNPWRDWPPRRGSASPTRTHVAEHRLQAEQAGIAQGAQFVEADAGEDFPMPRSGSARRRACSSSLARPARALAPTVEALPLMVCRVAALPSTSPSPSWRSSWAKRSCMSGTKRRNTSTISSRLPPKRAGRYRPAPRPVRPRPLPLPARPSRRSCRDDRAGKAPGASSVDRLRHMVVHARLAARLRGRAGARLRSISGPRRTARSPPAPAETARRRRGPPGRPRCSTARRRPGGSARCPPLPADARPATAGRSTGRGGGLAGAPCSCNACSTESASCLGVTGLVRKSTKGGALWSRASASTSRP